MGQRSQYRSDARSHATTADGRRATVAPTPERLAKGAVLEPLDALLRARLISVRQHQAGIEFGRLRVANAGKIRPRLVAYGNPGTGIAHTLHEADRNRYAAARAALQSCPRSVIALTESIIFERASCTLAEAPLARAGLAVIADALS